LCLNLQRESTKASVAESFLAFSPRVQFRNPGLIFVEISTTAHLFEGERNLMSEALGLARDFYPQTTVAIADSPSAAQVFSQTQHHSLIPPAEEQENLNPLPLSTLVHLEGLLAWNSRREVEDIIDFFERLG